MTGQNRTLHQYKLLGMVMSIEGNFGNIGVGLSVVSGVISVALY